ncbi:MAG: GNAT family N-acetyltransferase [Candidatus Kariarchaeaceae archaeon]
MNASISIESINDTYLSEILDLWTSQYKTDTYAYYQNRENPQLQLADPSSLSPFMLNCIKGKNGIVAKSGDEVIGFMIYYAFEFHGEKTVYIPIMGHTALTTKKVVYNEMYQYLSDQWIKEGYLNHLITFFAHDQFLKGLLFEMGFGLYVVDAFRSISDLQILDKNGQNISIMHADMQNIDEIISLGKEFDHYLRQAPLFLVFKRSREFFKEKLEDDDTVLFLAYVNNEPAGYLTVTKSNEDDKETLSDESTAMIIDTYIQPQYRDLGIGKRLLQNCITWCKKEEYKRIHVDFESANLHARRFWLKYFVPVLHSVKRRVNQDITSH